MIFKNVKMNESVFAYKLFIYKQMCSKTLTTFAFTR